MKKIKISSETLSKIENLDKIVGGNSTNPSGKDDVSVCGLPKDSICQKGNVCNWPPPVSIPIAISVTPSSN
jgi:hypothetical protein